MIDRLTILYNLYVIAVIASPEGTFKTTTAGPKPLWNVTHLDQLKKDLLTNYDRYVRPENYENQTKITFYLTITRLETDEIRSVVIVDGWINLVWYDSKLKWNEDDYGGIGVMKIADHEVWKPDIYLYNSVSDGEQLSQVGSKNVLVFPSGAIVWVPSIKLTALCKFNLRHWPIDRQYCPLKFTSWTLTSSELKFNNITSLAVTKKLQLEDTLSTSSWHVEGGGEVVSDWYPCCTYSYHKVVFHLNITRKSTPYCAIIVSSAVVSALLILTQFALPPHGEEKIILNVFIIIFLNFFLFYFNKEIYGSGTQTPFIVIFYSYCLYLAGISSIASVVTYLLSTVKTLSPPSRCVTKKLARLQKWLFLPGNRDDWVTVAICTDRILFLIYVFIFLVLAIALH
ncbi:hypothetical protein FQR65_LT05045 [Abscondita terminalis]|nr:hypothetical protein FQR65_LT05045 [Abscondita terminalis]